MENKVRMLSAKDLAGIIGSRSLAYLLFNTEGFPVVRLGKRLFVREDSFDAWTRQNEGQRVQLPTSC